MRFTDLIPIMGYLWVDRETDSRYAHRSLHGKILQYSENLLIPLIIGASGAHPLFLPIVHLIFLAIFLITIPLEYLIIRSIGDRFPQFLGWAVVKSMSGGDARRTFFVACWNAMLLFFLGFLIGYLLVW